MTGRSYYDPATKPATHSKTLIFSGLTILLAALNAATDTLTNPQALTWIVLSIGVTNAVLRWYTSKPLGK